MSKYIETLKSKNENSNAIQNKVFTKADMLLHLKVLLKKSKIEDILIVSYEEIKNDLDKIVNKIKIYFNGEDIVVRSSSITEDTFHHSNAGHFASVLNIDSSNINDIERAIYEVLHSYGNDIKDNDQILIQKQTKNVLLSGVVFTRDIQKNRSYYVINYDESGSTDSVTSGKSGKTVWISYSIIKENIPLKWRNLMEAIWEIENIFPNILFDIEFAVTENSVVIFQVRPLVAAYKLIENNNSSNNNQLIEKIKNTYLRNSEKKMTSFSDMAFWNPSEIIGDNPKNLDYSLYNEIITKKAWNAGIVTLGYKKVPFELMFRYGNKPYINLERSFEALMPEGISDFLTEKLKNHYINKLKSDLSAHDKIEFEISHNCYDFSLHKKLKELLVNGFEEEEIIQLENLLKKITVNIIADYENILKNDLNDLKKLEKIRLNIQDITKNQMDFLVVSNSIHKLLKSIEKYGTTQFSRHARCAFIANSLCKSLFNERYISNDEYNQFMSSIHTITADYDNDYHSVLNGTLPLEQFQLTYGHLRAGTYNIRSPRYDQIPALGVLGKKSTINKIKQTNSNITNVIGNAINKALKTSNISNIDSNSVIYFLKTSIEQREYFKFIFTKSLSYALELIKKIGEIVNIECCDLSYLDISDIYALQFHNAIKEAQNFLKLKIKQRKDDYRNNSQLILPEIIFSELDFDYIENINVRPNFITENIINAELVYLNDNTNFNSVEGKIVVIEKADPGYDWIFSKGIAGLITKYGGIASHLAIRCAEFNIPAAIGCGITMFETIINSKKVTLDCKNKKIYM